MSKQPKIIKKILTTLREETSKLRVNNSPLRASRVKLHPPSHRERSSDDSKQNSDVSSSSKSSEVTSHESGKVNCDTMKQIQASPPQKHLVRIHLFLVLTTFFMSLIFSWFYSAVTNC
jgi:NIMA (never in mitosis gene a)-related kinase